MKNRIIFINLTIFLVACLIYGYNPQHLDILLQNHREPNSFIWDKWRKQNPNTRLDLSSANINEIQFNGNFSHTNFKKTKLNSCYAINADFSYSDFSFAELKNFIVSSVRSGLFISKFNNINFYKTKIMKTNMTDPDFTNSTFNHSLLNNVSIEFGQFKNTIFLNTIINDSLFTNSSSNINFSKCTIKNTIFFTTFDTKMLNTKFQNTKILYCQIGGFLFNVVFQNTDLTGTTFYYFKSPTTFLQNVDFTNANLTKVDFTRATFQNVIFKNADMTGAKLERKWFDYMKKQGVRNFNKIRWM